MPTITTSVPRWLEVARKYEGVREVKGPRANPIVLGWLQNEGKGKSWVKDDATPWCGGFQAGVFSEAGLAAIIPAEPLRAASWASVGVPLDGPRLGAAVLGDTAYDVVEPETGVRFIQYLLNTSAIVMRCMIV